MLGEACVDWKSGTWRERSTSIRQDWRSATQPLHNAGLDENKEAPVTHEVFKK